MVDAKNRAPYLPWLIINPLVADFNGDGLNDISFYLYVGKDRQVGSDETTDSYEQVVILAERKPDKKASK